MAQSLFKRGTLLIPSGPSHDPDRKHLHIICTDPDECDEQLLVSVCSVRDDLYDRTCVLLPHEHEFLRKKSFVYYAKATILDQGSLSEGLERRKFDPHEDLNSQTFLRVTRGILISKRSTPRVKQFYQLSLDRLATAA